MFCFRKRQFSGLFLSNKNFLIMTQYQWYRQFCDLIPGLPEGVKSEGLL